jgi:hypothetical protein
MAIEITTRRADSDARDQDEHDPGDRLLAVRDSCLGSSRGTGDTQQQVLGWRRRGRRRLRQLSAG